MKKILMANLNYSNYIAAALLSANQDHEIVIEVRPYTEAELNDPEICCLDAVEDNKELNNYKIGMDLYNRIAELYNLDFLLKNVYPWWDTVRLGGSEQIASEFGIALEEYRQLESPLSEFLLTNLITRYTSTVLKAFGNWIINYAKELHWESLRLVNYKTILIKNISAIVCESGSIQLRALELAKKLKNLENVGVAILKLSHEWGIFILPGYQRKFNLELLKDEPSVLFIGDHNLDIVGEVTLEDIQKLLERALWQD